MRVNEIRCDSCNKVLEAHGKRSTVTISSVPAFRNVDKCVFDLCPNCAARLKVLLSRDFHSYGPAF